MHKIQFVAPLEYAVFIFGYGASFLAYTSETLISNLSFIYLILVKPKILKLL